MKIKKMNLPQILWGGTLFALTFFLFACSSVQGDNKEIKNKLEILESRIAVLEQEKLTSIQNFRKELAELKKFLKSEVAQSRNANLLYVEELDQLKQDIEQLSLGNDQIDGKIRNVTNAIAQLKKRIGVQSVALAEFKSFFGDKNQNTQKNDQMEKKDFQESFSAYKSKKTNQAFQLFSKFRKDYPMSSLADDALFYLGYIQFLQGRYNNATLYFFELIDQYPSSNKYHETKWWLAVALERTGDMNGAIDIYHELEKLPPENSYRVKAELRLDDLIPAINKKK